MALVVSSFPCLIKEMIDKVYECSDNYSFCYINGSNVCELNTEKISEDSEVFMLNDSEGIWNPDEYNLGIIKHLKFKNVSILFGNNGIVCNDSVLGAAIVWTSSDSKQRGIIEAGEFRKRDDELELDVKYFFDKAQLRGDIRFTTILYIKKGGHPSVDEQYLANECGCILGELEKFCLRLDGNGSMFPIYEISDKNKPLWTLSCEWEDPRYDDFSECIAIYINNEHKNYKYLDTSKPRTYDKQLLNEIIASALTIVIMKLKDEECWEDINDSNYKFIKGSVAQAVQYFITGLEWNVTKPELLSYSIRKFLDERI